MLSTILFAMVNLPVAIVNFAISTYLIVSVWRTPTPEKAHDVYKYSIAFPYIAGTVAGVQLVALSILWNM
jgi:hypothetical protein